MKRKVYLDGELGEKFGKVLVLEANSFRDVFKAINAQRPEFRKYLADCHKKDIGFIMHVEDTPLTTDEELLMNFNEGDMYVSPAPQGSDGVGNFLKVVAAVVIAFVVAPYLGATYGAFAANVAYGVAAGLALSGLASLLVPDPATDLENDSRQDSSYLFQGSGQTILEGDPVPVLYGRLRIPGKLIDFDLRNRNSQFAELGFGPSSEGNSLDPQEDVPPGGLPEIAPITIPSGGNSMPAQPGQTIQVNFGTNTSPDIVFNPSVSLGIFNT